MSVIFFSPYSAIWKHTEVELAFLEHQRLSINDAIFISCGGLYSSFCNAMSAYGLTENSSPEIKSKICAICKKTSIFKEKTGLNIQYIENYMNQDKNNLVSKFISSVTKKNWAESTFYEIPIGRAALFEIQLRYKLNNLDLDDEIWRIYIKQLEYCAKTVIFAREFLSANSTSSVVVYNELYSLNYAFTSVAKVMDIPIFSLQANGPIDDIYSRYSVDDSFNKARNLFANPKWINMKTRPLGITQTYKIYKYLLGLLSAKSFFVYSSRTRQTFRRSKFRSKWKIPENKKIVLFTMSSHDEIVAELFQSNSLTKVDMLDQINMTRKIIDYSKNNPDWFFILRPHPREFSNKREGTNSPSGKRLLEFIDSQDLPINLLVSRPEFKISLYQLILVSDYVLNVISSAGIEALAFGRRVLNIENSIFAAYPTEFNISVDLDLSRLQSIHNSKLKPQIALQQEAFRWLWYKHFTSTEDKFKDVSRAKFRLFNISRAVYVKKSIFVPCSRIVFGRFSLDRIFSKFIFVFESKINSSKTYRFFHKQIVCKIKAYLSMKVEGICIKLFVNILSRKVFFRLD